MWVLTIYENQNTVFVYSACPFFSEVTLCWAGPPKNCSSSRKGPLKKTFGEELEQFFEPGVFLLHCHSTEETESTDSIYGKLYPLASSFSWSINWLVT